jgi:hypothetical protein
MTRFQRVAGFIFFLLYFPAGVFFLHRATVKYSAMQIITERVFWKKIIAVHSIKSVSYTLVMKVDSLPYYLGVSYWSKSEAYNSKVIDSIEIGNNYTFYINPGFPISQNLNSGVSKITYNDKIIFEAPETGSITLAVLLIVFGLFCLLIAIAGNKIFKRSIARLSQKVQPTGLPHQFL